LQKVIKNSSCSIEINDFNLGENCESPQFKVTSYSTKDARLITESAAQLEIIVKCKNGKQVRIRFYSLQRKNIFFSSQVLSMLILMGMLFLVLNRFRHRENIM
jgi:hypothetical protein